MQPDPKGPAVQTVEVAAAEAPSTDAPALTVIYVKVDTAAWQLPDEAVAAALKKCGEKTETFSASALLAVGTPKASLAKKCEN